MPLLVKRSFFVVILWLLCALPVLSQIVTGGERNVEYIPPTAALTPATTAALAFAQGGQNTFLLDVTPTVSARVYLTNQTANACKGAFTITLYATATKSSTFQNALQLWQTVPVVDTNGALAVYANVDLPANGTVYVTSAGVSANRLAVQIVNNTGSCATTSLDARLVLSSVSLTSPLLSVSSGIFGSGSNVQGVVPPGINGASVLPVVGGALLPAINATVLSYGVDNFSGSAFPMTGGFTGNVVLGAPPAPSSITQWALAVWTGFGGGGGTGLLPPWQCIVGGGAACGTGTISLAAASLAGFSSNSRLISNVINMSNSWTQGIIQFVLFNQVPVVRQNTGVNNGNVGLSLTPLAGSTLIGMTNCNVGPCIVDSASDTQGNKWTPVAQFFGATSVQFGGQQIWVATAATNAADVLTFTAHAGTTINNVRVIELTGTTPAGLNQPNSALQADANGSLKITGASTQLSALQLGASAITLPASGTSALTNVVDFRGVKESFMWTNCTQGYSTNFQLYDADGVTVLNSATPLQSGLTGNSWFNLSSEVAPAGSSAIVAGFASLRLPQRAMAFSFTNVGATPGTCTARLFLQY